MSEETEIYPTMESPAGLGKGGGESVSPKARSKPRPGVSDYVAGEVKDFTKDLTPYLPAELVGGSIPHVPGEEDEAVWNAASQACATEKVHYTYTVADNRVWYLACPSASLASNPDTWCPLSAALPGNSEHWDKETVYLYEHEGIASALRWDTETGRMQVFLGASRTILPRVQSMDANFVSINADTADIIPWKNQSLRSEKLARATTRALVFSGILVAMVGAVILLLAYVAINVIERDLTQVKADTDSAAMTLMINAANVMQSDTIRHMVRIQELLDKLGEVDGTLVRYEINRGNLEWEALVPPAFAKDFGRALNLEEDGRVRVINNR